MSAVDASFWLKLCVIIILIAVAVWLLDLILRKILHVENRKLFSYNYVNEKHKLIIWKARITFIVVLFAGLFVNMATGFPDYLWFLEPYNLLVIFIIVSQIITAFMEWKHGKDRKDFVYTVCWLILFIAIILIVTMTGFLDWLTRFLAI